MKKIMKYAAALALLFGVQATAQAQVQTDEIYPNTYVSLQAGAQTTFTAYNNWKLITPQFAASVGHWMAPQFGVRLHVMGYQNKGGFRQVAYGREWGPSTYKFKAATADVDFMVNMSNVLDPHRTSQAWNWILLAGFGVNYAWDFDDFNCLTSTMPLYHEYSCSETKHSSFNGRLGTMVEYNISRNVAVNLELQANYKNDVYNLRMSKDCDWQVAALLGLSYRFGTKAKAKPVETVAPVYVAPEAAPVTQAAAVAKEEPKPAPAVKPEPKPTPAPVVKEEPLKETFFYKIRESDSDKESILNRIVAWCNKYPNKGITISGYADKGTGNPEINVGYAQKRAEKVAKDLQAKGISASRMKIASYGDKVQPFAENDKNRCVIVVGE